MKQEGIIKFEEFSIVRGPFDLVEQPFFTMKVDVKKFLEDNCPSWDKKQPTVCSGVYTEFWFEDRKDAFTFLMRWL